MLSSIYVVVAFFSFLIALLFYFIHFRWTPEKLHRKLPPGPRGLPIIGNLHILGNLPHRTLYNLSKTYGPILFLKLGNIPTVIISSPETAELVLKTHDAAFASRPKLKAIHYMSDGTKGLAFAPYGPLWRNNRKFCTQELLTAEKIGYSAGMRKEEIGVLVDEVKGFGGELVNLGKKIGDLIGNVTYRMLFGDGNSERFDLENIVKEMVRLGGIFNVADYVPFLEPFDIQGLNKQLKEAGKRVQEVFDTIINEHEQDARNYTHKSKNKDLVDIMLSYQDNPNSSYSIDRATMKAILSDMIVGAIDTSHTWIEWVFAEIIKHPTVMNKLQDELTSIVGLDRMVEEDDLPKLEYLELVLKETFRLHPVAPLLVPRESIEDVVISECYIPKGSRVMINCWALGHDPKIWSDNVEEFIPERFIGKKKTDLRGHDFHLLPFGYGRRSCPGINLGLITVKLIVAQLVHCFNWDLPDGILPVDLDMTEKFGLAAPRAQDLLVIPTYRLLC